ncbi:glycosyltransferase family 4 protein [Paenibacillus hamazuiensis]|uniref:glycosyltransferase family 4 protein n=1 Tax=Paenibacillus hamazuiensis TaxID=2936508 RepID=UPI00200CF368|nr:glycosyltransferase family 4 protein [Paenibacillus hamazuiensis]
MFKLRILILVSSDTLDGPGRCILNTIKNLNKDKYEVEVAFLRKTKQESIIDELKNLKINYLYLGNSNFLKGWLNIKAIIKGIIAIKKGKFQVIHSHLHRAAVFGFFISSFTKAPHICTVHNQEAHHTKRDLFSKIVTELEKRSYRQASNVVCVAEAVKKHVEENLLINKKKITVIPNCLNINDYPFKEKINSLKQILNINDKTILFGTMSRLAPQKGLFYLLEAFKNLTLKFKDLKSFLVLAGEGELREEISDWIKKNNLEDKIRMIGQQNPIDYLQQLDVFMLPSLWEGMPISLIEAMRYGLPCIVTDVGGNSELIEHGYNGIMVSSADVTNLEMAMQKLLADMEYAKKLGNNAQKTIMMKYNCLKTTKDFEQLYDKIIN